MTSSTRLEQSLDHLESIIKITSNQVQGTKETHQNKKYQEPLKNCQSCFISKVEDAIKTTKEQILRLISWLKHDTKNEVITANQKNILRIVANKLGSLNNSVDQLLKDGALSLYMDMCQIRDHSEQIKITKNTTKLIKEIIDSLLDLLRFYFVFQEYMNNQPYSEENKENTFKSQNGQIHLDFTHLDQKRIQQIEQRLASKSLHLLLGKQCINLQKKMREDLVKCRICQNKIRLQTMEKHVKICQKKNSLKQQLQEKNYLMNNLLINLKKEYDQLNKKNRKQKVDQDFKKLANLLLKTQVTSNNVDRRCSLMCSTKQKSLKDNIQKYIQGYMQEYGENELLLNIVTTYKDKIYTQKKLNSLDMNSIDSSKQKYKNGVIDQKLDGKVQHKLSIFFNQLKDEKKENTLSSSSFSNKEIQQEKEKESPSFDKIKKMKLKKCKSRNCLQDIENQDLDILKRYSSLHNLIQPKQEQMSISLQSFQILEFLGQGAFGKVYMVRRKQTQDIYALKIIKFSETHQDKDLQSIENEHQIFKKIGGDHLVNAPFSFSEKSSQMFVLEYLPGGDLRKMLDEEVYFDDQKAKFYLAEIILAIEHLHKFGIIHRDLKPQNLVIDKNGHLKLTDFGLSEWQINKKLQKSRNIEQDKINSPCRKPRKRRTAVNNSQKRRKLIGTPDYIAPQIINGISLNNFTIDWWSLGVMAYELLIGARPFCAETIEQVIDNIINFKLEWPQVGYEEGMISPDAKDLICQLLNKDFTKRLGVKGADELKMHPYFSDINWQNIKTSKPSFLPKMVNVKHYSKIEEDTNLRDQIDEFIGRGEKKSRKNGSNLKLQRFVRYDILGSQTIETVQKIHKQQTMKLKKLRTLHDICLSE